MCKNEEFFKFVFPIGESKKKIYHRLSSFESALRDHFTFENSEYSQVFYWDCLIRRPIQEYFDFYGINYRVIRNSEDERTKTLMNSTKRPDFLLYFEDFLLFKGEEKASMSAFQEAKIELADKESYFDSDILICYAAAGSQLRFYALDKKRNIDQLSDMYDLNSPLDRLKVVSIMFNLCSIFRNEIEKKITRHRDSKYVDLQYWNFKNCSNIWELVYEHKFANFVHVKRVQSSATSLEIEMYRGEKKFPENDNELLKAIKGVLRGLHLLHRNGWVHTEIRWSNIVYYFYNYRLTNFDNSLKIGTKIKWINEYHPDYLKSNSAYTKQEDLWQFANNILEKSYVESIRLKKSLDQISRDIKIRKLNSALKIVNELKKIDL